MKRKLITVIVAIGILAATMAVIFWIVHAFTITNIIVSGDAARIEVNAKQFVGNILFFNADSAIAQIVEDNPLVKSIEIKKHFPSTLELVVYKRQPIARLKTSSAIVGIDGDGVVTDALGEDSLPVIEIDVPLVRMGQVMKEDAVKQAAAIVSAIQPLVQVRKIERYESASLRVITKETNIFFPQKGDIRKTLDTLQTLISGFRIKGTMPKTIDLRFDKPVVQF